MKKIYKLGVIALLALISTNMVAQDSKLSFGVNAGINLSNSSWDVNNGFDKKAKVGFQIGGTVDYAFTEAFYLQSGLSLTTKGAKVKGKGGSSLGSFDGTLTVNQYYLQVPIMGAYKLKVADNTNIVFSAGPYLALGVGGKTKAKGTAALGSESAKGEEKVDTFSNDGLLNRFDMGLAGGVAAEFGQIVVGLKYELGLTDIGKDNLSYKNRNAALTIGYRF